MFEELAAISRSRSLYLPGLFVTIWALTGVLWRGWSAGDAVFWVWYELILASISLSALIWAWNREAELGRPERAGADVRAMIGASLLILFFASLFTTLAVLPEIGGYSGLPAFLEERRARMFALACAFAAVHVLVRRSPELRRSPRRALERPWSVRAFSFLGVYLVAIFHHHIFDGEGRSMGTLAYGRQIAAWLLGARLLIELWSAWRTPLARTTL